MAKIEKALDAVAEVIDDLLGAGAQLPVCEAPPPDIDGRRQGDLDREALAKIELESQRKKGQGSGR